MASGGMKKEIGENHDALRFGVNAGVKGDLAPPHPLQATIQSEAKFWADKKRFGTEAIYGSAFNIRKDLDAQILSKRRIVLVTAQDVSTSRTPSTFNQARRTRSSAAGLVAAGLDLSEPELGQFHVTKG